MGKEMTRNSKTLLLAGVDVVRKRFGQEAMTTPNSHQPW
jgi:hypothetical protein